MLTGNDNVSSTGEVRERTAHSVKVRVKRKGSWFERLFVRFGAGSYLLDPLTKSKYWNAFCWTVIVLGAIGWAVLFWFLEPFEG